ncbi:unnamed protein product [Closterium sp. NIES-53]
MLILSTGVVVGLVLALAEPTSGSGVRSAADLQQWASWSTGLVDLQKGHCKGADLGRAPTCRVSRALVGSWRGTPSPTTAPTPTTCWPSCTTVAKKSDALQEFVQWLAVTERQTKKSVLMLRSDRGGELLGKQFTKFVNGKGIVHDLTCPYTPQQNGMAEHEMRMVVESVQTMLLHMGVQRHRWYLALQQAVWVRNCLERLMLQPGTTPYQLLTRKKPDLLLARVWGCMAQFLVREQQRGGKLKPKARWGLHLGVSE